jgi:DNA invertase Pin-like site-specific DNA recombinase
LSMTQKKPHKSEEQRKTALCYIRQSFTRDGNDKDSPERQRANIQAVCARMGWTPEFYEDAEGHKSGREEKNRPGWLALKGRLDDPDVIALVANDLSRLHRKGWRVGDLIDYLDSRQVTLVLAAPGREIDLSSAMGRLFVQFSAIMDEWYAADISQRAKDNIAYRKAQGQTVGMPPFGTIRNKEGYLMPSPHGAWLLADGTFTAGTENEPPQDGATWHSYYDAAHFLLSLYSTGEYGLEKIAYKFNDGGWAFRDRTGKPRLIDRDDVRRVVSNWAEYGGMVIDRKAKDRAAYEQRYNLNAIPLNADRAVFPLVLLKEVAKVRHERTIRRVDQSVKRLAYHYALSGITYCSRCEALATKHSNSKLRSLFSGNTTIDGTRRYRHRLGVKCGCINRSVPCHILDSEFERLVKLLTVREDALEHMTELAIQADRVRGVLNPDPAELEREKAEAIALCRKRMDAAVTLFGDGMIDRTEYRRRLETNEREIAHWQNRTNETQKLALELGMCIEAVEKIARLWDMSDVEDKQGLARSLFTQLTFDLDTQRIVDFRLKPWADRFLTLRATLCDEDDTSGGTSGGTGELSEAKGMLLAEIPYGAQNARLLERRAFLVFALSVILGFIQCSPQDQETACPRFERKANNPLLVKVVHKLFKQHSRRLLTVFVLARVPHLTNVAHHLHAHSQLNCCRFYLCGARLPMGNFSLTLLLAAQVFFTGQIPVFKQVARILHFAPIFGNRLLLLLLKLLAVLIADEAILRLRRQLKQDRLGIRPHCKKRNQPPKVLLDHIQRCRSGFATTLDSFGVPIA